MQHEYICVHDYLVSMSVRIETSWMHTHLCMYVYVLVRSTGAEPRSTTIMWYHTHCPTYLVTECVLFLVCVGRGGVGLSVYAVVFGAPTLTNTFGMFE